jgi:hypothetical protein
MLVLLWCSAVIPLAWAWWANRHTTLRPALAWAGAGWAAWVACAAAQSGGGGLSGPLGQYLALCLTCCAGVAVLGARRPGAGAWNFVVVGLLAVLLLPVAQGQGVPRLHAVHLIFLGLTLGVIVLNYLPTRLGLAAALFGAGCALETAQLAGAAIPDELMQSARIAQAIAPWLAGLLVGWGNSADPFDRTWRQFRDRFGLFWSLRIREQINRAAANAGWGMDLGWSGHKQVPGKEPPPPAEALQLLQAALKRFQN